MTDEQALFAVICFLYITDCFLWLDRHSVAFVSSCWKKWKLAFPSVLFGNVDAGLVLLNPLPPIGLSYVSHLLPISISPIGICAYNLQTLRSGRKSSQSGKIVLFADMKSVHSKGKALIVNESEFAKYSTESQTSVLAHFLNSVRSRVEGERESIIRDFFQKTFDANAAQRALSAVSERTRILRFLCNISFFFIFVVTPALVMYFGLRRLIIPVGICFVMLSIRISVEFYRSHRSLYPQASEDRIGNFLKMVLCPPVAIRAIDIVANPFLASFNPLTIANILLDGDKYKAFAKEFMLDLKYPIHPNLLEDIGVLITRWHSNLLFDLCRRYLDDVAKLEIDLMSAPVQADEHSKSYCPRCLGQFTKDLDECPDCSGVELVLFSPNKAVGFAEEGIRNG